MIDEPKRILVVDDDSQIRSTLKDYLESMNHEVETAQDGFEALAKLEFDVDLVLTDLDMPGMDGYEITQQIRENPEYMDLPIIMITGLSSRKDRLRAVETGVDDFIAKPIDTTEIRIRVTSLLKRKEAQDALKQHKMELEGTVKKRTASLRKALEESVNAQRKLQEAYLETIYCLTIAAEYKDEDTAAHIKRMSQLSALIARKIGLPPGEVELVLHASPMHDIGKIGVPEEILLKPGKLNPDEWNIIKQHPQIGSKILKISSSRLLHIGEIIALYHHEKWNGKGYPNGIAGTDIPIWGRICAVTDVFDALVSKRPYKKAFTNDEALKILWDGRGEHFDPELVDALVEDMDEVVEIQKRNNS